MRVAFRTDASLQIGNGHIMRCLTLADVLRDRGAECIFICRPHAGNLMSLIASRGYQALALPALQEGKNFKRNGTAHADWLGTDWFSDARDTQQLLADNMEAGWLDWLVVDHYALDRGWEHAMRPRTKRIMAIDDLADRAHDCDLLLDQNLGRSPQDYMDLLGADVPLLIGPQYALLRSEFVALRPQSLARRAQNAKLEHLLIFMGGLDKDNVTGQVLVALKACGLPSSLRITVVMGQHAPWLEQIQALAEQMPLPTDVLVGVSDMAQLMAESDLAIGAVGGSAWERCCLGLPSIVLVLAENQQMGAEALQRAGVVIALERSQQITDVLCQWKSAKATKELLTKLSTAAAAVTDGRGCDRAAARMMEIINA